MGKITYNLNDFDMVLKNGKTIKELCLEHQAKSNFMVNYEEFLELDDDGDFIAHIYCTKQNKKGILWQEVLRFNSKEAYGKNNDYYSYGMNNGFKVHFSNYYSNYSGAVSFKDELEPFDMGYVHFVLPHIYGLKLLQTNEEIIELDNSLKYFSYREKYGEICSYIERYRKYPCIELLAKIDADYKFVYSDRLCNLLEENKSFRKFLLKNRDFLSITGLNIIQCFKGKSIEKLTEENRERNNARKLKSYLGNLRDLLPFKANRIVDYIENLKTVSFYTYKDYLLACQYLNLNFNDTKVAFPRNFMEMHDLYTEVYHQHLEELERQRQIEEIKANEERETLLSQVAKQQSYLERTINDGINDYVLKLPTCTDDFINEGTALHHCVGRMGYNKKMANGEDVIIFLRKIEQPDVPFITIEWLIKDNQYKLAQIYADHDTNPSEEIRNMVIALMDSINSQLKKGVISIC